MSFVIGFHRSGTSLLTSILHDITGARGNNLFTPMGSAGDNPEGFFESMELFRLNNHILETVGHHWTSPWLAAPSRKACIDNLNPNQITSFIQTHPVADGVSPWIDKEPQLCLTIDIISTILNTSFPTIGIIRHPLAAAESLRKRNGFSKDHALGLWIVYNYHAFTTNLSQPVELLSFEELISGAEPPIKQIDTYLEAFETYLKMNSIQRVSRSSQSTREVVKRRIKSELIHCGANTHALPKGKLEEVAVDMWESMLGFRSSHGHSCSEVRSKSALALAAVVNRHSNLFPSSIYSRYQELARRYTMIEEEMEVTNSKRMYWEEQSNMATEVIRALQTELLEQVSKASSLVDKLEWNRRCLATTRELILKSNLHAKSLYLKLAELLSN